MAAAKSGYEDVFGGPPRSFAARVNDYAEIFGGPAAGSAGSIPVLDLPPAMDGFDSMASLGAPSSGLDYSEVFGGFKGWDFAVSYEELVSSSNGRTARETGFGQQAKEASEFLQGGSFKDRVPYLEKNKLSSNSFRSDDGTKQFSMSYHKTSRGSIDDVINGTAYVTHLHAVPGFTFSADSCPPLQDVTSAYSPNTVTNGFISKAGYNGNGEQVKVIPPSTSCVSTTSCGVDLKEDQRQFINGCHASKDGALNMKHHSRSSSNHSVSSGDVTFPDATYLTVSDISLQTQPSRMPPPSRPPPNLVSKQGHPKMKMYTNSRAESDEGRLSRPVIYHQTRYSKGASKVHAQEAMKDGSFFCDVEVDASSAAAASAAAMKVAMEQAEARLKSAKESMGRKQVKFQSRKKVGLDGWKEDRSSHEGKIFSEVITPKMSLQEDKAPTESFFNMGEKTIRATKIAPNHGEKDRYPVSAEEDQEILQGNGFKSSQVHYNLEEISGEWKTEKQFYELINNKCKTANEVSEQEVVEKQPQATTRVSEEKENLAKEAEVTSEFGRNEKLSEVSTTGRMEEHDESLEAGGMVCKEELRESTETILEACLSKEYMNRVCEEKAKIPGGDEELPGCEKRGASYESCKVGDIHDVEAEEPKLEAAEAVCRCEDTEKEPKGTYETCEPHGSEDKLKVVSETGSHDIFGDEIEVALEAENKTEEAEEANQCETIKIIEEKNEQEYSHEESEFKLGSSSLTLEQEEARLLNRKQEPCTQMENDLEFEGAQDTTEWEETLEKFEAIQGTMGHSDNGKKMDPRKEAFSQDYTERKTTEAQPEVQLNEKTKKAVEEPRQPVNCEELSGAKGDHGKREDENVEQIHIALDSEEILNRLNSAGEICQKAVNNDLEDVQHPSVLEKQCNSVTSAQAAMESHPTVVTNNITPDMYETEIKEKERIVEREEEPEKEKERERTLEEEEERERMLEEEKERERILEEEKEREREREKDRLAVERASREAHQRALAEARERAERIAVERVTAEARQRALAEAREKAEKAAAEIMEKSLAEKASREARLRTERAAVERATAEARERAVERAIAEKDARERAARLNATSRDRTRKENETEYRTSYKEDNEARLRSNSDALYNGRSQTAGSSASSQRYSDPYNHGGGESALRCKARLERHQRTVERAAKALAEKNMRDVLAQREQAERDRLAESLDADVKRWSNGKEGNLRALLSTLQYILGAESGWQPIPLTDVITAVAVKKAYRKATLFVHPDKLQQRGASIQQKYICEKVFDLLKEAWNRFNSEER